jgi:protein-tyrosine phosphatase
MAEKLFVDAFEKSKSKKNVKVFSAGISAMDGDQASENSIDACEEIGLDLKDHRSAALTRATAENASAIFCMTESHRALLEMYFDLPKTTQVFLMREFMEGENKELPDPYGQNIDIYRDCRENMKESIPSLLNWVEKNL